MAYQTSTQFHNAVLSGSPNEKALIVFGDDFFNDRDIDSQSGLTYIDYFNTDEEMMIGSTPSSTLNVTIINDLGLLDSLSWNTEFVAYLGVETVTEPFSNMYGGILYARVNSGAVVTVNATSPYVYCNGTALTDQPSDPVVGLWIYKNAMYAIAEDGTATKYNLSGSTWIKDTGYVQSAFMENKFLELIGVSRSFDGHYLRDFTFTSTTPETWGDVSTDTWADVSVRTWGSFGNVQAQVTEYVPLGYFKTSRPKVLSSALVEIEAYDRMVNLEVIADSWFNNLAYPKSINDIITAFCKHYSVTLDNNLSADPLPNGTLMYSSLPTKIENVTAREVLSHLAEATGSVARFTRDGNLRFDWFKSNALNIPWWFEQTVYSYYVAAITGVLIRSTDDESGQSYGTSDNPYVITDNIFLPGSIGAATLQTIAQNIYIRLSTFAAFPPSTASITSDWSIVSGDVLTINSVSVPVYTQTITYNGGALATIENTGEEVRPVDSSVSREAFTTNTAIASAQYATSGLKLAIENQMLTFDADGLHILNGGFDIYDANNKRVLYADTQGNLSLIGDFYTITVFEYESPSPGYYYYYFVKTSISSGRFDVSVCMDEGSTMPPSPEPDYYGWRSIGSFFITENGDIDPSTGQTLSSFLLCSTLSVEDNLNVMGNISLENGALNVAYESYINTPKIYLYNLTSATGTDAQLVYDSNIGGYEIVRSSSSRKYKKNIKALDTDSSAIIDALKPITYEDKSSESGTKYYGFIAEDVEKVCPMLVQHNKNGEPESLMYDRITVLLADDNKKLRKRVDELETRLAKLEALIGGSK